MSLSTVTYTALIGVAIYALTRWWNSRGLKYPPGPPGHFLIGNLLDLPKSKEWLTFNQWANKYGELVYITMPGASMLFVNSSKLAKELFEKRGNLYSDRFQSTVFNDILKVGWSIAFAPYGDRWRRDRVYFHQFFNQTAVENYHEIQMKYTKVLLKRLYRCPGEFQTHARFIMGASALEVAYGFQPSSEEDPFVVLSEDTVQKIGQEGIPGTYLIDFLPILRHVPTWFPGAKSLGKMYQLGEQIMEMYNKPVEAVKDNLRNGNATSSATSTLMEQFENDPDRPEDYEEAIKRVTGTVYTAAVDTFNGTRITLKTTATLLHLFVAVLLYPEVQKRAQQELDEVVGSGDSQLPSFEDFGRLKYIQAIAQELLRWNAVVPVGLPHTVTEDDVVNGYFIPKGTIVFGNSWSLLRNKAVYGSDADKFKPERFFDKNIPPPDFAFGYGRRECPGRHFAENGLFIAVACILHLFKILPFEGENGPELPTGEDFDSGAFLRPKTFKCRIVPRSPDAVKILEELDG